MFSPGGERILYAYFTHPDTSQYAVANYSIISIENGETEPVSFGVEMFYFLDIHWDESGLYILYEEEVPHPCVRNVTTSDSIFCWGAGYSAYIPSFSFSPQGNKVGYWVSIGWFESSTDYLHVVDLNLETDTCIAYSDRDCEAFAFSPDESKVAYIFGQGIYMDDIP